MHKLFLIILETSNLPPSREGQKRHSMKHPNPEILKSGDFYRRGSGIFLNSGDFYPRDFWGIKYPTKKPPLVLSAILFSVKRKKLVMHLEQKLFFLSKSIFSA